MTSSLLDLLATQLVLWFILCIVSVYFLKLIHKSVLCIDFSKAFDIVDYSILLPNLVVLGLLPLIVNWVISFLMDRKKMCQIGSVIALLAAINRSIIQGFGLGPLLYYIMEVDLHPILIINLLFKYEDDTKLIVPENFDVCLLEEFDHIKEWAKNQNDY